MAADPGLTDPFARPRTAAPVDLGKVRRNAAFLARRGLRLVVALLVVPMTGWLLLDLRDPRQLGLAVAVAVAAWLPATWVQGRVLFQPSPPDPWLGTDGTPRSDRDLRAWMRADVSEWLLGTGPPVALLVWYVSTRAALPPAFKFAALTVALAMIGARQLQAGLALVLQEARLDLEALRPIAHLEWLERLEGPASWVGRGDQVRYLVARGRFRVGDAPAALAALDRIRNPLAWRVDLLRALFGVEHDGWEVTLAVAASVRDDPDLAPLGVTLTALAELYQGRDDRVLAKTEALLSGRSGDARWFGAILVAAARAGTDPDGARALIATLPWHPAAVRSMCRGWGPLAARLEPILSTR
ncbi:MAG: hypothetical protein ABMA64_29310 [Myxococcota bacterium]